LTGIKSSVDSSITRGKFSSIFENKFGSKEEVHDNTPKKDLREIINFVAHENSKEHENQVGTNNVRKLLWNKY